MRKVLGEVNKGLVFVISAPAGTGKTTLVRMLSEEFSCVVESVSYTTRKPRPKEVDGVDYHFVSTEAFERMIHAGDFIEYARVFDHYYGTSRRFVEAEQEKGRHVVLVIDTQGALQLMGRLRASFIFISPPSLAELRSRLTGRKSETPESIEHRLSWAENEMALASRYDYHIVNDHLKTAYDVLRAILIAEEHKNNR
jgi:guanylate kinase